MGITFHFKRLACVSVAWLLFWLAGLPDYYRQYAWETMLVFDLVILVPICVIIHRSLCRAPVGTRKAHAIWWAFYISIPLFVYDALYCGIYLGHGPAFLIQYWYITVYYLLPWLIFPALGRRVGNRA